MISLLSVFRSEVLFEVLPKVLLVLRPLSVVPERRFTRVETLLRLLQVVRGTLNSVGNTLLQFWENHNVWVFGLLGDTLPMD